MDTKNVDIEHTPNTNAPDESHYLFTFIKLVLWFIGLFLIPQLVVGAGYGVYYAITHENMADAVAIEHWIETFSVQLSMGLFTPLITFAILWLACRPRTSKDLSRQQVLPFETIHLNILVRWLMSTALFFALTTGISKLLALPDEPLILEARQALNEPQLLLTAIVVICIFAPIIEELIFRGWLLTRLRQTKLADHGALLLSAIIFSAMHTQYQHVFSFIVIFALGLLLAYARLRSGNLYYPIAMHILFNCFATLMLIYG